jgi:cysteinyl-tRNA synthetase
MRVLVQRLGAAGEPDAEFLSRFRAELENDLNFPRALALAWELLKSDLPDRVKKATILRFDEAFGLRLGKWQPEVVTLAESIVLLMEKRACARTERRWADADTLRAQARELGYELEDTPQGQQARKVADRR